MELYQLRVLYETRDASNTHVKTHDTVYAEHTAGLEQWPIIYNNI